MNSTLAVFMPSWVGDAVMATPTLRALSKLSLPGRPHKLIGIMQPVVAEVLSGGPWIDEQIVYSKRRWSDRLRLAWKLRAAKIDTVLLMTNSWWTAAIVRLAGIKQRVGYARDGRSWLLTDRLPALKREGRFAPVPAIDYYLQLAAVLNADISNRRTEIVVEDRDRRLGDDLMHKIGFHSSSPLVVINSSGVWGNAKVWPADHVEQLARRIVANHDWQVLLHCGPAEREAADAVAMRIGHDRVQSMGRAEKLPIGLTKAVLERAATVVSTDSGPRHIAIALDKPVVSLFGPTDPAWTTSYNVPEIELGVDLPCRGCWKKTCPLEHNRCMRDLGVEQVYAGVVSAVINRFRKHAA